MVEAKLTVVVKIVVLPAFNKRHKLIISFKVPIHVLPLVDCITKALRHALLALELDEYVLLLRRFEQIDHDGAFHEFARLIAWLVRENHDVTAVVRLEFALRMRQEIFEILFLNIGWQLEWLFLDL